MFNTILVSAHHDDAALSVGAMAALGMIAGPLLLVTVFSISGFAPLLPSSGSIEEITAARTKEDSQFASFVGATTVDLGFEDAPLRFPNEKFESLIANGEADMALIPALALRIRELVATSGSSLLLAPMGHGGHVDHLTVRAACDEADVGEAQYYLDQPYVGLLPYDVRMGNYRCQLDLRLQERIRILKLKIASFYPSQPAAHRMTELLAATAPATIVESVWKI